MWKVTITKAEVVQAAYTGGFPSFSIDRALSPNLGPPEAGFSGSVALSPNVGPPEAGFFRLCHDDGLVTPSG